MSKLTKVEIKQLKPLQEQFRRALYSDWCVPLTSDYSYSNSCGTCILNLVKYVGKKYENALVDGVVPGYPKGTTLRSMLLCK
mgnify:CR=1 FL=1